MPTSSLEYVKFAATLNVTLIIREFRNSIVKNTENRLRPPRVPNKQKNVVKIVPRANIDATCAKHRLIALFANSFAVGDVSKHVDDVFFQ